MLTLFYLSLTVSIGALLVGLARLSGLFIGVSAIAFVPTALYFLVGANNAYQFIALTPVVLLVVAFLLEYLKKRMLGLKKV
ncbi:hypothetical protein [Bacillus ndiopicus]|uniref:hypothetical protein n=1 Tax=Bacillus ndiopicus TaxID=1347368 RepID=UPI0005A954CC|nr:hypothetical protein [Bacillus ndiopicus]